MPRVAELRGGQRTVLLTMLLCVASLTLIILFSHRVFYFAALLLFGFGNAGTRVARMGLLFNAVPNSVIGRVSMFFGLYDRVVRTVLTFGMTLIVARGSATPGFAILLAVLVAAVIGVWVSRRAVVDSTTVPHAA